MKSTLLILIVILCICYSHSQQDGMLNPNNNIDEYQQSVINQKREALKGKKIFGTCPPSFVKIHNDCYYFSSKKESWIDSHFHCKDMNSKLAEPLKYSDKRLRKYLNNKDKLRSEKWIGGMYNWERMKWQWGHGKDMTYQAFDSSKTSDSKDFKYHCATLDPTLQYRWSAKFCTEKHNFICQKRMNYVTEKTKQRERVRPANNSNENKIRTNLNESTKQNIPRTNENIVKNIKSPIANDILSYNNNHVNRPINREKRKGKTINLDGNVDLGLKLENKNRTRVSRKRTKMPPKTNMNSTETSFNKNFKSVAHKTREHRPNQRNFVNALNTTVTTPAHFKEKSTNFSNRNGNSSEEKRNRLKQKLAKLTPEERAEFYAKKRERDARKRKQNLQS